MARALNVAKFLLELAEREDEADCLSHLRLQKLLYYTQGWSLALREKPLFKDLIEAWAHGPVVKNLYPCFASYGNGTIPSADFKFEGGLDSEETELVEAVWDAYKKFSATSLREMSHREKPWKDARGTLKPAEKCEQEITHNAMKKFFKSLAKKSHAEE